MGKGRLNVVTHSRRSRSCRLLWTCWWLRITSWLRYSFLTTSHVQEFGVCHPATFSHTRPVCLAISGAMALFQAVVAEMVTLYMSNPFSDVSFLKASHLKSEGESGESHAMHRFLLCCACAVVAPWKPFFLTAWGRSACFALLEILRLPYTGSLISLAADWTNCTRSSIPGIGSHGTQLWCPTFPPVL